MFSPTRFDGAAYWSKLPDEKKAAVGAAALELFQAHFCRSCIEEVASDIPDEQYYSAERMAEAAQAAGQIALAKVCADALPFLDRGDMSGRLLLPSVFVSEGDTP